ncbi:glycosyltransferase family 8 protein [Franconibacter helveticus]|uniref:glycosyltransferase family 8 protein n=1 Tax=Franconibacter helveticus TaxID=357240 RepID=UPI00066B9192|nr:glycosyltransferase family 8 protein [Franconibacter helveticus]
MTNERSTIVLAIQKNYITPASVLLTSLIKNNSELNFDIYILCDTDISEYFLNFDSARCKFFIKRIDIHNIKDIDCGRFGIGTLFRLMLDEFIPHHVQRILYLDSDIIVNGSIQELLNIELSEDEFVAAVECSISKKHVVSLGLVDKRVFNAGVILFDYRKCCQNEIFKKSLQYVKGNNTAFNDQDALNVVLNGKVKYISDKWNYEFYKAKRDLISNKISEKNKTIIHYTGKYKPWQYEDINPYSYLFHNYYYQYSGAEITFEHVTIRQKIIKKTNLVIYKNSILSRLYLLLQHMFRTHS